MVGIGTAACSRNCRITSLWWTIAGDELREEGHEQRVVDEVQPVDLAPVRVHEERDLLKREKRDADRQHDLAQHEVEACDRIEVVHEEVGILEVAQRREVERDAED
jgi:hypothetical protein